MKRKRIIRMSFGKNDDRIDIFHLNKPQRNGVAGIIISKQFCDEVGIIVNDDLQVKFDVDLACFSIDKNRITPIIIMERDIFYGLKRGDAMSRFILFHELGHYYNKDINKDFNTEKNELERINYVEQGIVQKSEIMADEFAVKYLGKDVSVKGLKDLYDRAVAIDGNSISATEIDLRINLLQ